MKHSVNTHICAVLTAFLLTTSALSAQQKLTVVNMALAQDLVKIFPDISSGYIDFSGNGKPDQTSDLNEYIPESRIRDGQLQVQEILDFIVENWRFIPLDKLKAVRTEVQSAKGAINELIAIDYSVVLDEAVSQREEMGDGLYLTPSSYKEAMVKMNGIVTSMVSSYKKEGSKSDAEFMAARDSLFDLIDKGYPLPLDLPEEERNVLSTSMTSVILKEQVSNPKRTRTSIRVLGLIKSTDAAPYLVDLASGTAYPKEAMKALGEIGYKPAIPAIAGQLKNATSPDIRKAALQATGAIGGAEGLDTILDTVKPASRENLPADLLEASTLALAGIAQKGNTDIRIQSALKELVTMKRPAIRKLSAQGLGAFNTPVSVETLLALVNTETDVSVRKAAVIALNRQKSEAVIPAFLKLLKEKEIDPSLQAITLTAMGDNAGGAAGIAVLIESLANPEASVREAAANSLKKLYPANTAPVTAGLTRALTASQDEAFLVEGTTLLSVLAEPSSLPTLQLLLSRPFPEVKRMAVWAIYRISSASNPKVVEETQKLVTNENESLAVRINAVRALGAMGYDTPQLNVSQTLVTTMQMRGEKYAMLRYFSVRSLGTLLPMKKETVTALLRTATKDPDMELRKEAVTALKGANTLSVEALESLAGSFIDAGDSELKVRIIETLADLGSTRSIDLASEFLSTTQPLALKKRVISASSQSPSETSAALILDAAADAEASDFITAVLEGYPTKLITSVVTRRMQSENDKNILSVLVSLEAVLAE